jgi:putative DNA base modification enzyme with NMAD domain
MKLYSYVVARDYGFAPNPFFGVCTLATCKPMIRKAAALGDWVVGTGSKGYRLQGQLVYAMKISETLSYDEYWDDPRYRNKRPNLRGSLKQAYGDNIYHTNRSTGRWVQTNSHHSNEDGTPNAANIEHDTQAPRVLIGTDFVYWGRFGPKIPKRFQEVCAHRGHKCQFSQEFVTSFVVWIQSLMSHGYAGKPAEFPK